MRRWAVVVLVVLVVAGGGVALARELSRGPTPRVAAKPTSSRRPGHHPVASKRVSASLTTTASQHPVTIAAVGDTELGNIPQLPPDPASYLQGVRSALAAPILFGNLEGTLTDSTASKCGAGASDCYAFRVPPSYAQVMRDDGFTVLNSANNHSHDFGDQGVSDTSAALRNAGIAQAGLPGQVPVVTDGSTRVAFVDFAPYTDVNNLLDFATARRLINQAKAKANIVVVYMHAGAEGADADHVTGQEETYVGEDRGNPEAFAHAAINDGANLVIASGPHVLRGMQFYKGDLIAYSLGNFADYGNFATGGDLDLSGILRVTLSGSGHWQSGRFISLHLEGYGQPAIDPTGAAARFVNQLSTQDFGSSAVTIEPDGTIKEPPSG